MATSFECVFVGGDGEDCLFHSIVTVDLFLGELGLRLAVGGVGDAGFDDLLVDVAEAGDLEIVHFLDEFMEDVLEVLLLAGAEVGEDIVEGLGG